MLEHYVICERYANTPPRPPNPSGLRVERQRCRPLWEASSTNAAGLGGLHEKIVGLGFFRYVRQGRNKLDYSTRIYWMHFAGMTASTRIVHCLKAEWRMIALIFAIALGAGTIEVDIRQLLVTVPFPNSELKMYMMLSLFHIWISGWEKKSSIRWKWQTNLGRR